MLETTEFPISATLNFTPFHRSPLSTPRCVKLCVQNIDLAHRRADRQGDIYVLMFYFQMICIMTCFIDYPGLYESDLT